MTRKSAAPSPPPLPAATIADLQATIDDLRDEIVALRQAVDELFTELQWSNRNRDAGPDAWRAVRAITSMPVDPSAPDWGERLNRYTRDDVIPDQPPEPPAPPAGGRLF